MRRLLAAALAAWMAMPFGAMAATLPPFQAAEFLDVVAQGGAVCDGVTDDSTKLIAADTAAAAAGKRYLFVPTGKICYAPSLGVIGLNYLPTGYLSNTILIGDGAIRGGKNYRRVVPISAPSAPDAPQSDLIPSQHLKLAATKALTSPLVVDIMGDSTCTPYANEIAPSEFMAPAILQKIQRDNPGRAITFNNRCVGGQGWTNANSTAGSNQPPWYTNTATPWLNYVSADAPDLLIFNFGMNPDTNAVSLADFHGVLAKVAAFAKAPSIAFITNKQPSYNPTVAFGGYPQDQESRYVSAGFIRTFAKANGYGLLDFNRRMRILRDGLDPVDQRMVQAASGLTGQALPYTFPQVTEGDYDLQFTLPNSFWTNYSNLSIQVGNRSDNIAVLSVSGGSVQVNTYEGMGYPVAGFVSGMQATPASGSIPVEILVKRGRLTIVYNGTTLYDATMPMMGGPFTPALAATLASGGTPQTIGITSVSVGVGAQYMPALTDADIYQSTATMGGNTLNHANSRGVDAIESPVIAASRFSVAEAVNPVNPLGTSGVVVDLPSLTALGTVAGNTAVIGGGRVNVGSNTEYVRSIVSRCTGGGSNYSSAEWLEQHLVDTSAFGALVYSPCGVPQGVSLRTAGIDRVIGDSFGNIVLGQGSIATTATDGFLELPNMNGMPTGVPAHAYGRTPGVIDTADSKVCFYIGAAWKCATLQ
jgi:hypothetical protein